MSHIQIDIVMEGTKILYMRIKKVRKGRIKPNISTYIPKIGEANMHAIINGQPVIHRTVGGEIHDIYLRR